MKIIIIALLLMLSAYSNAQPETEKEMEQEKINLIFPLSPYMVYMVLTTIFSRKVVIPNVYSSKYL